MMRLQRSLMALRIIGALGRQLTVFKVPEIEASIRIILEHSIRLATSKRLTTGSGRNSAAGLASNYAVRLLRLRKNHYPIQYLLGKWHFRQLELKLRPPILIPRFETEFLVGEVIEAVRRRWPKGSLINLVDLGCGSGAIGLSLIKQLSADYSVQATLLDVNQNCIALARLNAQKNNIAGDRIRFVCEDMRNSSAIIKQSNLIVSNPPYLTHTHHRRLQRQVRMYEAHQALVGGQDGLDYIRFLLGELQSQRAERKDAMWFIEYGGEDVSLLGAEEQVRLDQYGRRRFLMFTE